MTLKARREKIEELRELGRVFEECKLELEELENSLKETDEAISKKLESTLQPPPVFHNPEPTPQNTTDTSILSGPLISKSIENHNPSCELPLGEPTRLPEPIPPAVAKENNQSGSSTSLPDLHPSKETTNVLTGSIHSTLETSREGNLTPSIKNDDKVISGLLEDEGASKELAAEGKEKIATAFDMIKNLVKQDLPYKQETDPRSLRTDENP